MDWGKRCIRTCSLFDRWLSMITLIRTDAQNQDFIKLVKLLDADLAVKDGDDHAFYSLYNKIESIKFALVAFEDKKPVGCGAIKNHEPNTMEVKRMYVLPEVRGKGIATKILAELENWVIELGCSSCILETGKKQPDAIALYIKNGYSSIPNYGQYAGVDNSVCFEKKLNC